VVALGLTTCIGNHAEPQCQESEAMDRTTLGLPGVQLLLLQRVAASLKPGARLVLLLINGGPIAVVWCAQHVHAILEAWYPGAVGGAAIADLLFGVTSPSGRLPLTVPATLDDLPPYLDLDMASPPGRTYRYSSRPPLYAFGFGLSYASFEYSGLQLHPTEVSAADASFVVHVAVTLARTDGGGFGRGCGGGSGGDCEGGGEGGGCREGGGEAAEEVAQLYVSLRGADRPSRSTPHLELKHFRRASLCAGDSLTVELSLAPTDLLSATKEGTDLAVAPGVYDIYVGGRKPGPMGMHVDDEELPPPVHATLTVG